MKGKIIIILKTLMSSVLCLTLFLAVGYLCLQEGKEPAETKQEEVPYFQLPQNKGVMMHIGESRILFYLGFDSGLLSVVYADEFENAAEIYGYSVDFILKTDYSVLEKLIDELGGIVLEQNGELLNMSGAQVTELLKTTVDKAVLKREITQKIIEILGQKGMTVDDLIFLIEASETTLSVPDCYFWAEYMAELCKNVRFVN